MGILDIFLKESPNSLRIDRRISKPESLKKNPIIFSIMYKKPTCV